MAWNEGGMTRDTLEKQTENDMESGQKSLGSDVWLSVEYEGV